MADYAVLSSGNLVAIVEGNAGSPRFSPPKIFGVAFSVEHDRWELVPLEWQALELLAPDRMVALKQLIMAHRNMEPPR